VHRALAPAALLLALAAVQGFNENASVLAMLGVYGALVATDVPIVPLMWGFGLLIALAMAGLMRAASRTPRAPAH